METAITAIGTALPHYQRQQVGVVDFLAQRLGFSPAERRITQAIYRASDIVTRHSVLSDGMPDADPSTCIFPTEAPYVMPTTAKRMQVYRHQALPLAQQACENCLADAPHVQRDQITHLITVSCTGMYAPGIDIELVSALGLSAQTKRTCINFMGCYGAFNAFKVADSICRADPASKVLVVCVELCSLHYQHRMEKDNIVANAIFADGSGAVLVEAHPTAARYLSFLTFESDLLPNSSNAMAWHIADQGFDIVLSGYVPDAIEFGIGAFLTRLLQRLGLAREQIDFYAIHPGGTKILEACERALQLTPEANRFAYQVLRDCGNMSSATIIFVLKALWEALTPRDNEKRVFSAAFGPGLTLESMLLKTHCSKSAEQGV